MIIGMFISDLLKAFVFNVILIMTNKYDYFLHWMAIIKENTKITAATLLFFKTTPVISINYLHELHILII